MINEEMLKLLKKHNVKSYKYTPMLPGAQFEFEIEFFSPGDEELEKKPRADEKVNEATGLTRSQTRDILNMDE